MRRKKVWKLALDSNSSVRLFHPDCCLQSLLYLATGVAATGRMNKVDDNKSTMRRERRVSFRDWRAASILFKGKSFSSVPDPDVAGWRIGQTLFMCYSTHVCIHIYFFFTRVPGSWTTRRGRDIEKKRIRREWTSTRRMRTSEVFVLHLVLVLSFRV